MEKPRVTIGLPVYNGEKYLRYALDSILSQSYQNFQVIISDNASTDKTEEICREYMLKDSRISYYRSKINLGMSPNHNKVFTLSDTEYFRWAGYDDMIDPNSIQKCVDILDQNPDVVLCFSRVKLIDGSGQLNDYYNPDPQTVGIQPQTRFRNLILHPHLCTQLYGLIRSSALKQTSLLGGYPSADEVLLAELGLLGEFYEIPEYLFYSRRHEAQSTVGVYVKARSRVLWFDTSLQGKVFLPKWVYFFNCLRVINHSKVQYFQKISCMLTMIRWLFTPANFRALGKDLLIAASKMINNLIHYRELGINP